ncbi:ferritin-like domain-containing protein [Longimicrobium sp.]|uniref:ferritin-like domain-containing protein n=1 Tax=Longimicrobium sp. TaxID=2029185 RepID=UPI003B3AD695
MNNESILGGLDPEVLETMASRRDALRGAGRWATGLAFASVPLALAGMARNAFAQTGLPQAVVDVLNFALTLEELEAEFYVMGVNAAGLIPASDRQIFTTIRDHEVAHVQFLRNALGSAAVAKPTFDFTAGGAFAPFTDYEQFKALSQAFEDTGVRAYKGQAPALLVSKPVLRAALTIHSVEARHASEVRRLRGNFTDQEPQQGWITLNLRGTGMPAATQPVYDGEENITQAGINISTLPSVGTGATIGANQASESFDEPLTREQVLMIVDPFIVGDVDGDGTEG